MEFVTIGICLLICNYLYLNNINPTLEVATIQAELSFYILLEIRRANAQGIVHVILHFYSSIYSFIYVFNLNVGNYHFPAF